MAIIVTTTIDVKLLGVPIESQQTSQSQQPGLLYARVFRRTTKVFSNAFTCRGGLAELYFDGETCVVFNS